MPNQPRILPPFNRPTWVILGVVLFIAIVMGVYLFLQREGHRGGNPTQGHTELLTRTASA